MRLSLVVCLFTTLLLGASPSAESPLECDVEKILEARELPPGSMVSAGTYGGLTEVSTVFVPQTLEKGKYEVTVSRESENLYVVDGESLYLKTSVCMEYATMQKAVLEVADSQYGFGTLYFVD
jgi:hypothetical protein